MSSAAFGAADEAEASGGPFVLLLARSPGSRSQPRCQSCYRSHYLITLGRSGQIFHTNGRTWDTRQKSDKKRDKYNERKAKERQQQLDPKDKESAALRSDFVNVLSRIVRLRKLSVFFLLSWVGLGVLETSPCGFIQERIHQR